MVGRGGDFTFENGGNGGEGWSYKKLDLPTFDGQNPNGWILVAERFFKFYRLSEEVEPEASVVALNGDALFWFQWGNRRHPIRRWEKLKGMLLRQFRSTFPGTLHEQWLDHRQWEGVVEYGRKFIELKWSMRRLQRAILLMALKGKFERKGFGPS